MQYIVGHYKSTVGEIPVFSKYKPVYNGTSLGLKLYIILSKLSVLTKTSGLAFDLRLKLSHALTVFWAHINIGPLDLEDV